MANGLKTAVLLGALSGLLLLIGDYFGGQGGLMMAFGFAVLMNLGSYWFSDKIVLRMYRARQVGDDHPLSRMVQRLAQQAGLPMPKVYVIPTQSPNAFATGRNPSHAAVAATEGIMRMLDERELEGVMAHELAHVKNRDSLIMTITAVLSVMLRHGKDHRGCDDAGPEDFGLGQECSPLRLQSANPNQDKLPLHAGRIGQVHGSDHVCELVHLLQDLLRQLRFATNDHCDSGQGAV